MNAKPFLCAGLTLASLAVEANPFAKPAWADQGSGYAQRQERAMDQLTLKAILWSSLRPLANINGQILEIGDSIAGFTVSRITENQVLLEKYLLKVLKSNLKMKTKKS